MCVTVFTALCINGCFYGTGQHNAEIQPQSDVPIALKVAKYLYLRNEQTGLTQHEQFWWLCEPIFIISNMAIKASIGIMLIRLTVSKTQRYILYANIAITQIYSFFFFFIFLFQCYPSSYFWARVGDPNAKGSCMNPQIVVATFYGYSAIACITDWTFSILPVFLVWNLQMGRREKASVILILATGAL
jgi:hypothetical protein